MSRIQMSSQAGEKGRDDTVIQEIKICAARFLLTRDQHGLRRIFDRHKAIDSNGCRASVDANGCKYAHTKELIAKENLRSLMDELFIPFSDAASDDILFDQMDVNRDGEVDFEDVKTVHSCPSKVDQWMASIPLGRLVASALLRLIVIKKKSTVIWHEEDHLKSVSMLSDQDLSLVIEGIKDEVLELMKTSVHEMKLSYEKMDEMNAKNSGAQVIRNLSCGEISDFYNGVGDRVGCPNPKFYDAMKQEHESEEEFTTDNYGLRTCPAEEWRTVIKCDKSKEDHNRKVPNVDELMQVEVRRNDARMPQLIAEEIIAIVLYTGPMFQVYNTVLRRFPEEQYRRYLEGGNLYSTTIHCLVSGVTQVSRSTTLPAGLLLYRGLGGIKLPPGFFDRKHGGHRGFVEWAFMSTTSNKSIAMQYTGAAKGRALPTLLCIRPAAVDHGADIGRFSQYPGEKEYLWNPCSLIEPFGEAEVEATPDGLVTVIPVRVNMNIKTMSVEQLRNQKKEMHLSSFRFQHEELRRTLVQLAEEADKVKRWDPCQFKRPNIVDLVDRIVGQSLEYYVQHQNTDLENYLDDKQYRGLVIQMLEVKAMALSKFYLWRDDRSQHLCTVHDFYLREAHRARIMFLERNLATLKAKADANPSEVREMAVKICQVRGLINVSVDEVNHLGEVRLVRAAAEGANLRTMQLLVDANANVNSADPNGRTVIQWVALGGDRALVQALLDMGACIEVDKKDGWTPVMSAALRGQIGVIELMQEGNEDRCAPVNTQYRRGWTALWFAAMGGQVKTVELLCRLKADVNLCGDDGFSPLMAASLGGHVDTINALCEHGANVRAVMRDGLNGVYLAAIGGHSRAIVALCDRGADPDAAHHENGFTAAFVAALGGHADAIQALMDKKADVHKRTDKGLTALQIATLHRHSNLVELLSDGAAAGKFQMNIKRVFAAHKRRISAQKACRFLRAGLDSTMLDATSKLKEEIEASREKIAVLYD